MTVTYGRLTFFNETKDLCKLKTISAPTKFIEVLFNRKLCKMEPGIYCKNNTKVMDAKDNIKYFKIFGVGDVFVHEVLWHKEVNLQKHKQYMGPFIKDVNK